MWRDAALLVALAAAAVVITFFGIDTSRLAGWAFPMILFSWKTLADLQNEKANTLINAAHILNLAIPSYYASLNFIVIPSGLYSIIFGFFSGSFIVGIENVLKFEILGTTLHLNDILPTRWGTIAIEKILSKNLGLADITNELMIIFVSTVLVLSVGIIAYQRRQLRFTS